MQARAAAVNPDIEAQPDEDIRPFHRGMQSWLRFHQNRVRPSGSRKSSDQDDGKQNQDGGAIKRAAQFSSFAAGWKALLPRIKCGTLKNTMSRWRTQGAYAALQISSEATSWDRDRPRQRNWAPCPQPLPQHRLL